MYQFNRLHYCSEHTCAQLLTSLCSIFPSCPGLCYNKYSLWMIAFFYFYTEILCFFLRENHKTLNVCEKTPNYRQIYSSGLTTYGIYFFFLLFKLSSVFQFIVSFLFKCMVTPQLFVHANFLYYIKLLRVNTFFN